MQSAMGLKWSQEDTVMAYDEMDHAFRIASPYIKAIGLGMPSNMQKNSGSTIKYKPFDEFCLSWLGGSTNDSPPPIYFGHLDKKFGIDRSPLTVTSDVSGFVSYGPLKITGAYVWQEFL